MKVAYDAERKIYLVEYENCFWYLGMESCAQERLFEMSSNWEKKAREFNYDFPMAKVQSRHPSKQGLKPRI
jgi:hypothetical protein